MTSVHKDLQELFAPTGAPSDKVLDALFLTAAEAIVIADTNRRIVRTNAAFTDLFGYEEAEVLGFPTAVLYADTKDFDRTGRRRFHEGASEDRNKYVVAYRRKNGTTFQGETSGNPIPGPDGTTLGFLGTIRNVSEEINLREELAAAKDVAEAQSQARLRFISNASHEIRTPLNGIVGMLEALSHLSVTPEQVELLAIANASARDLTTLLDTVLDLSKMDAGEVVLKDRRFDVSDTVHPCTDLIRHRAESKGLKLAVTIDTAVPGTLVGDASRIQQILNNLLGNAVKFTERGSVEVSVRRMAEDDGAPWVVYAVTDTGRGVPAHQQETIFERFTQARPEDDGRGTGLGLDIVRQLVEAMEGRIGLDSTDGVGSTFWFALPLRGPEDNDREESAGKGRSRDPEPVTACRVLLAEDNPTNAKVVEAFLRAPAYDVTHVPDGETAVFAASRQPVDIVLMDINMPGIDGLEATRRIRAMDNENRQVPIVGLTAHVLPETLSACIDAGMNDVLTKPFSRIQLEMAVLKGRAAAGEKAPGTASRPRTDGLTAVA